MVETIFKTKQISKAYGKHLAVKEVDMCIKKGDIYGLVGENGAGKTTLMKMICGMALPTNGEMKLFESEDLEKQRERIGVLIETPALFPNMTARENLTYFQILMGKRDTEQIDEVLQVVGLSGNEKKKTKKYSLGMKQRLGIAIALLGEPEFLILDEPINGLDVSGVKEIRELLLKLNQEKGITILISSHILSELSRVANRFGILREGKLEEEFTATELESHISNYVDIHVSDTASALPLLHGMGEIMDIQKISQECLRVFVDKQYTAAVNRHLVENGVDVTGLEPVKADLESYYLNQGGEQDE